MAAPSLATEVAAAGEHPSKRYNQRERRLLETVKDYVDSISASTIITTQGDIIIGDADGAADRLAKGTNGYPLVAGASTVSYAQLSSTGLASSSVTLAKLASGVTPSHVVKYAGTHTTAGGAAAEAITVAGVAATDVVLVTIKAQGSTPRTVLYAAPTTDTITVTFSDDPSTDHVLFYQVLRAAS